MLLSKIGLTFIAQSIYDFYIYDVCRQLNLAIQHAVVIS